MDRPPVSPSRRWPHLLSNVLLVSAALVATTFIAPLYVDPLLATTPSALTVLATVLMWHALWYGSFLGIVWAYPHLAVPKNRTVRMVTTAALVTLGLLAIVSERLALSGEVAAVVLLNFVSVRRFIWIRVCRKG